jgi:hypothetical protein
MSERPPNDWPPRSADDLGEPDPFEVIDRRGRYILGAAEDYYGVWDTRGGDRYLERFPLTEEGFQAAERRFIELRRLSRRQRGVVPMALRIALLVGVGLWVLAGAAALPAYFEPRLLLVDFELIYVVDAVGFRVGVGALLLVAGVLLLRRERATRRPKADAPGAADRPVAGSAEASDATRWAAADRILVALLAVGLVAWAVSSITTQLLFRQPNVLPPGTIIGPETRPHFVALFVEILAFRLWVTAFVLLLIRWVRSRRIPASISDDEG